MQVSFAGTYHDYILTYEDYVLETTANNKDLMRSIQKVIVDYERLQNDPNVPEEVKKKQKTVFMKIFSVFIQNAYADEDTQKILEEIKSREGKEGGFCIYAGWPSVLTSKGLCPSPITSKKNPFHQFYLDSGKLIEQECLDANGVYAGKYEKEKSPNNHIICNPYIFGYRDAKPICVINNSTAKSDFNTASTDICYKHSKNNSYDHFSEEKNKGFINKILQAVNEVCLCKHKSKIVNGSYAEKISKDMTCAGYLKQVNLIHQKKSELGGSCNLISTGVKDTKEFTSFISKYLDKDKMTNNDYLDLSDKNDFKSKLSLACKEVQTDKDFQPGYNEETKNIEIVPIGFAKTFKKENMKFQIGEKLLIGDISGEEKPYLFPVDKKYAGQKIDISYIEGELSIKKNLTIPGDKIGLSIAWKNPADNTENDINNSVIVTFDPPLVEFDPEKMTLFCGKGKRSPDQELEQGFTPVFDKESNKVTISMDVSENGDSDVCLTAEKLSIKAKYDDKMSGVISKPEKKESDFSVKISQTEDEDNKVSLDIIAKSPKEKLDCSKLIVKLKPEVESFSPEEAVLSEDKKVCTIKAVTKKGSDEKIITATYDDGNQKDEDELTISKLYENIIFRVDKFIVDVTVPPQPSYPGQKMEIPLNNYAMYAFEIMINNKHIDVTSDDYYIEAYAEEDTSLEEDLMMEEPQKSKLPTKEVFDKTNPPIVNVEKVKNIDDVHILLERRQSLTKDLKFVFVLYSAESDAEIARSTVKIIAGKNQKHYKKTIHTPAQLPTMMQMPGSGTQIINY